ncbi:uncharacterized protein Tco025E_09884, partial [Trypanosoma conorhini]
MRSCGVDGILALDERGANCCCRPFSSGSHSGVGHVAGLQVVYIYIHSAAEPQSSFGAILRRGRVGPACVAWGRPLEERASALLCACANAPGPPSRDARCLRVRCGASVCSCRA